MELSRAVTLLRTWTWLFIFGLVVGGCLGLVLSDIPAPVYQAATKILVSRPSQGDSSELAFLTNTQLIDTYIEMLKAKPILDEVSSQLAFEIDPEKIRIEQVRNAQLVEVKVEDNNAQRSAAIANSMVSVLIQQNDNLQMGWYGAKEENLKLQIDQVKQQINDLQSQFDQIQDQDIQAQVARVDEQIAAVQDEILAAQNEVDALEIQIEAAAIQKDYKWLSQPNTKEQQALIAEKQARLSHLESSLMMYQQIEADPSATTAFQKGQMGERIALLEDEIAGLQKEISELNLDYRTMTLQNEIEWLSLSQTSTQRSLLADKQAQLSQLQSVLTMYQQIRVNLVILGKPHQLDSKREDPRIQRLQATLDLYDEIYLNLTNNLEAIQLTRAQSLPNITQIEPATIPEAPVRPVPLLYAVLSGVVGLLLVAGFVGWFEFKDTTIKTKTEAQQIFGVRVIGNIHKMDNESNNGFQIIKQPYSPLAEAFRTIQANLAMTKYKSPLKTLLVSGVEPGNGSTTIAVNLALTFAQSDKKVVILDANIRNPGVREMLGTKYKKGLTDLFDNDGETKNITRGYNKVNGVTVIPHGSREISGLIDEDRLAQIIKLLKMKYDIVVIDGPSVSIADAQLWASKVDGILLVIQPEFTHTAAAVAVGERLNYVDARLLGVVLNTFAVRLTGYPYVRHWIRDILSTVFGFFRKSIPNFFRRIIAGITSRVKQRVMAIKFKIVSKKKIEAKYQDLKGAIELSADPTERIRYQAVLLRKMGYQFEDIENITGCSRSDLLFWERRFESDGLEALQMDGPGETIPT